MEQDIILDAGKEISRKWDIAFPALPDPEACYRELQQQLSLAVEALLLDDMARLINIMYRLDIREKDFDAAMAREGIGEMAAAIAELILNREIEKAHSRKAYRNWMDKQAGSEN
jgi:hypothetical protein